MARRPFTLIQLRLARTCTAHDLIRSGSGIVAASAAYWSKHHELWNELTAALIEEHLVNVSPVVQDQFMEAMNAWLREQTTATPRQFADFVAASAVVLTRPGAVKALLATYEPRAMPGDSSK